MFTPVTPEQSRTINQLRDVVNSSRDSKFLHVLPDLLETQKISPSLASNCYMFAQNAVNDVQHPVVLEALSILDKLIDGDIDTLLPPSHEMFVGRYFKWGELGNHKDAQSTITHIINKSVTLLQLQAHHS